MESRLPAWTAAVERIDAALKPIATRPVALTELASLGERYRELNPLDEAGVRDAAAALLTEILDAYPRLKCAERIELRALFDQHRSLGWAAGFLLPTATSADRDAAAAAPAVLAARSGPRLARRAAVAALAVRPAGRRLRRAARAAA